MTIDPRWLKVLECGSTRTVGQRVVIKSHYFEPRTGPNGPEGCCYLEGGGHFNLYDQYGHAHESDFPIGRAYIVMHVGPHPPEMRYANQIAYLRPDIPDAILLPHGI